MLPSGSDNEGLAPDGFSIKPGLFVDALVHRRRIEHLPAEMERGRPDRAEWPLAAVSCQADVARPDLSFLPTVAT